MSKLSRATDSLTQHQNEVIEALRRIRLDMHLSSDGMRAAIDEVIAMVSYHSITNLTLTRLDTPCSQRRGARRLHPPIQTRVQ